MSFVRRDREVDVTPHLCRSFSLPGFQSLNVLERRRSWDEAQVICIHRKAKSLTRVGDQSNSAAPIRRQPHPFAMQALGLRPVYAGQSRRLPEWPPPDPPPLTPLNFGMGRNFSSPSQGVTIPTWPPRPWWRRNGPSRPPGQVVHVAFDTTDVTNTLRTVLSERPAHIAWTSTSEDAGGEGSRVVHEVSNIPVPQHASISQVEDDGRNGHQGIVSTTIRPIDSNEEPISEIPMLPSQPNITYTEDRVPNYPTTQANPSALAQQSTLTTVPTEDIGMISLNSEVIEEGGAFQVFFVVVDSNPGTHDVFDPEVAEVIGRLIERMTGQSFDDPYENENDR
ncbi:unnamed protein product [Calicophoron daubneyi]|uniref:Uncharacterized protein n=1 Tax=Calicophoron daubneyi TaxID=300641 RepID=A0AAV2TCS3_CALDB